MLRRGSGPAAGRLLPTHLQRLQYLAEELPHGRHVRVQHDDHLAGRRRLHLLGVELLEAEVEAQRLGVHLACKGRPAVVEGTLRLGDEHTLRP